MTNAVTKPISANDPRQIVEAAAWVAILANGAAILLLIALHILSPEFSPSLAHD